MLNSTKGKEEGKKEKKKKNKNFTRKKANNYNRFVKQNGAGNSE